MKTFLNLGGDNDGFVWSLGWFPGMPWAGIQFQLLTDEGDVFKIFNIQILKFLIEIAYIKKNG